MNAKTARLMLGLGGVGLALFGGARHFGRESVRGKIAIVGGASRGLGRAIARELARRGCHVAICARSLEELDDARRELEQYGVWVIADVCDLRRLEEVDAFVARVEAQLGPIAFAIANAATISVGPIEDAGVDVFDEAMESIFATSRNLALTILPRMQARGKGTIAFVTSIGGKIGVPHLAPYSAAKFAEVGFAEALRAEVAKDGVHVLTVVPGLMRTGSHLRAVFRGQAERELAWFGASAIAPLLSIDADRAAKKIVSAIERGKTQLAFTPAARIVARTHDLFPGLYGAAMAVAGALLPRAPQHGGAAEVEGRDVARVSTSKVVDLVRRRSARIALRHGQTVG
jgi:short-subunit dehydrogenase